MSPFLYALNIGTLSTWLTVAGASSVACVVKVADRLPELLSNKDEEIEVFITPMSMGSAPPAAASDEAPSEEASSEVAMTEMPETLEIPETPEVPELPEMPELPEIAEMEPLPEVPDLPKASHPDGTERPKATTARPTASRPKASNNANGGNRQSTSGQSGRGTGTGNGTAQGSGDSPAGADRWIGLRKVKPNYPSASRKNGEHGRVVIRFTVDERGSVVNATIIQPCPYAALNEAALASVRRFKARPGVRATGVQAVVFQLN